MYQAPIVTDFTVVAMVLTLLWYNCNQNCAEICIEDWTGFRGIDLDTEMALDF
jgi:hypothetical protein